jgi:uncharacterized repeat protein (TIGR03803 family)
MRNSSLKNVTSLVIILFLATMSIKAAVLTNLCPLVEPYASLILCSNTLYGTAGLGGTNGDGMVFAINTDGTGFTNLHSFILSDGEVPYGALVLNSNILYGTTLYGGSNDDGVIFAVNTDGTGFTNLHIFGGSDGKDVYGGLVLSSNILYGTTAQGGSAPNGGKGTVFAINTDGSGFTNLFSFPAINGFGINNNGAYPEASLVLSSNTLYGTAQGGGTNGSGTIFAINTDGSSFTNLHNFNGNDGMNPQASLALSCNMLYGTTFYGGSNSDGTLFAVNNDGAGFTNLYVFNGSDGAHPRANLFLSGSNLYGTAQSGGGVGANGTVFTINTNGSDFTNLYLFLNSNNKEGGQPYGGVLLYNNSLYGTTYQNGYGNNSGTAFVLSLGPIPLNFQINGGLILNWGNPAFILQSTTNVAGSYSNVIGARSPYTNNSLSSQMFFRLKAN